MHSNIGDSSMNSRQRILRAECAYAEAIRNMSLEQRTRTKQPLQQTDRRIWLMRVARARWLRWQRLRRRLAQECRQSGTILNEDGSLEHHP